MSRLAILGPTDIDWVSDVVDIVESSAGRPWRDALDRLDDLQRARHGNAPRRFGAVVGALQRLTGGRGKNAAAAREARGLVLGAPALSEADRHARIVAAAETLAVTPAALEKLLWSDLPRERPVELPYGRPHELEVAAFANVAILQRTFRRAQAVTLRIAGDPGPILRACRLRGLLAIANIVARDRQSLVSTPRSNEAIRAEAIATEAIRAEAIRAEASATEAIRAEASATEAIRAEAIATEAIRAEAIRAEASATEIVIVGPLALFHRTSVYGRALADLVPLLGELREFELEIFAETSTGRYSTEIESTRDAPILLPDPPARLSAVPYPAAKLARALARIDPTLAITPLPPPIIGGTSIQCADLLVERGAGRCYVEIVGFWTAEYVKRKLAAYRAAGQRVIVCVDASGASDDLSASAGGDRLAGDERPSGGDDMLTSDVLMFRKHVVAEEIVARLQHRWGTLCR